MSSYTGLLLLPWEVPVAVAGRQPFNDLRHVGRLERSASPHTAPSDCRWVSITPSSSRKISRPRLELGMWPFTDYWDRDATGKTCTLLQCPCARHWVLISWRCKVKTEFHRMNHKGISILLFLLCGKTSFGGTVQAVRNFHLTQQVSECPFCSQLITVSYIYECVFVWNILSTACSIHAWQIPKRSSSHAFL